MLNQVVIVGRLTKDPEVFESDNGKKYSHITLAVPRSFKNADGEYETDFIRCTLWENIAQNTSEYCKTGDIVGIKGRIQSRQIEEAEIKKTILEVIAERVTFLSSSKEEKKKNKDNK